MSQQRSTFNQISDSFSSFPHQSCPHGQMASTSWIHLQRVLSFCEDRRGHVWPGWLSSLRSKLAWRVLACWVSPSHMEKLDFSSVDNKTRCRHRLHWRATEEIDVDSVALGCGPWWLLLKSVSDVGSARPISHGVLHLIDSYTFENA